jgi:glycosyltransferase involved in cell wall biosynthesis
MSVVYKGKIIETSVSTNARGGTEMMRDRLIRNADSELLSKVAVHFSRPRQLYDDVPNILYCHDLAEDPENKILENEGWSKFDHIVFVSAWQRDQFIVKYGIPHSRCTVVHNAIEKIYDPVEKKTDKIKFIYHTTPHRGLELLYHVFDALCKKHDNIELDVYSSFDIYGWPERDEPYQELFRKIKDHPNMNYFGTVSNEKVLKALDEAHIFLYPCIWKETSCIALIEAIKSQVLCIHPNYGALPETSAAASVMYEYTENIQDHVNYAYSVTNAILNVMKDNEKYFNGVTLSDRYSLVKNNISSFTSLWNSVLLNVIENK